MTTAERLRLEGRTEGRMESRRELLLRVIQTRFGSPPDDMRSKIHAADLTQLEVWFDRALTAADLQAVFAD